MKNSDLLHYKGYTARPEYSVEDRVFYGTILGIDDMVDFQSPLQNQLPAQPGLKALQLQQLEQRLVVPAGPAPLRVVVQNLMLRFCPGTARALSHVSSLLSFPARLGRETRYHLHYSIEIGKWKPAGKVIAEKK